MRVILQQRTSYSIFSQVRENQNQGMREYVIHRLSVHVSTYLLTLSQATFVHVTQFDDNDNVPAGFAAPQLSPNSNKSIKNSPQNMFYLSTECA